MRLDFCYNLVYVGGAQLYKNQYLSAISQYIVLLGLQRLENVNQKNIIHIMSVKCLSVKFFTFWDIGDFEDFSVCHFLIVNVILIIVRRPIKQLENFVGKKLSTQFEFLLYPACKARIQFYQHLNILVSRFWLFGTYMVNLTAEYSLNKLFDVNCRSEEKQNNFGVCRRKFSKKKVYRASKSS